MGSVRDRPGLSEKKRDDARANDRHATERPGRGPNGQTLPRRV